MSNYIQTWSHFIIEKRILMYIKNTDYIYTHS